jgi:Family of unknown function (DUF6364)
MKKLTLNAEPEVIEQARRLAEAQGTSVSSLFARIVRFLAQRHGDRVPVGRLARGASGLVKLPRGKSERDVIEDALVEKYRP